MLPSCVVFLNGFPGVGKLAIARALKARLQPSTTRLIDNHLFIDPADAISPGRGAAHKALRAQVRRVAFDTLKAELASTSNLVVIMTGCLADTEEDRMVFLEHLKIARASKVPFILIDIACDPDEHRKRFEDPGRHGERKTKLQDPAVLNQVLAKHILLDPGSVLEARLDDVELTHIRMDTTKYTVTEICEDVLVKIRCVLRSAAESEKALAEDYLGSAHLYTF